MSDTSLTTAGAWLPMPANFNDALEMAKALSLSPMVPVAYRGKPMDILIVADYGARVGLPLLTALQGITVINGKPAIWGDCMLAVARAHPDFEDMHEVMEGAGDELRATCTVTRREQTPVVASFSVAMARKAGLWDKGVWRQYPARMLAMRARSWAIRNGFADALQGIGSAEEFRDIELSRSPVQVYDAPPAPAISAPAAAPEQPAAPAKPRRGRPPGNALGIRRKRRTRAEMEAAQREADRASMSAVREQLEKAAAVPPSPTQPPASLGERMRTARDPAALQLLAREAQAVTDDNEVRQLRQIFQARSRELSPHWPGGGELPPPLPGAVVAQDGLDALKRRQAEREA